MYIRRLDKSTWTELLSSYKMDTAPAVQILDEAVFV